LGDPEIVDRALRGLKEMDLAAWEHEVAHKTVAELIGAAYQQRTVGEGVIGWTLFQRAVGFAAGPAWDRMNGSLGQNI
jgi:hypothetical protein